MSELSRITSSCRSASRRIGIAALLVAFALSATLVAVVPGASAASSLASGGSSLVLAQEGATPVAQATPVAPTGCDALAPGVGSEAWIRAELYFGTTMPDGSMISDEDWQAFLDEEITPRFPAGLTVLEGYGQFLNSAGIIAAEESIVLIIFYPGEAVAESSAALEEIRDAYELQFDQESVLRVDAALVCVSF